MTQCALGVQGGRSTRRPSWSRHGWAFLGPSPLESPGTQVPMGDRATQGSVGVWKAGKTPNWKRLGDQTRISSRNSAPAPSPKGTPLPPPICLPCHSPCHWPKAYRAPASSPVALAHAPGAAHSNPRGGCGLCRREAGGRCGGWGRGPRCGSAGGCDLQLPRAWWHRKSRVSREKMRRGFSRSPFPLQTARVSSWGLNIWEI